MNVDRVNEECDFILMIQLTFAPIGVLNYYIMQAHVRKKPHTVFKLIDYFTEIKCMPYLLT